MLISIRPQPSVAFHAVDSYSFALTIFVPGVVNINQRQTTGVIFVNRQGTSTDSSANTVIYTLVNGHLFANASSGTTEFGTQPNVDFAPFVPQANPGNITTTFAVDS
jgi:hypothetical protein